MTDDPPAAPRSTSPRARSHASKIYGAGETEVRALDAVNVEFDVAAYTAIMGPSGSGKSTLLHCMAGLDRLTSGQVFIGDIELSGVERQGADAASAATASASSSRRTT